MSDIDREVDEVIAFGASKHGDPPGARAWRERETEPEESYQALLRHLAAYRAGQVKDPETGKHPLAHVIARAQIMYDIAMNKKDDDAERNNFAMGRRSD